MLPTQDVKNLEQLWAHETLKETWGNHISQNVVTLTNAICQKPELASYFGSTQLCWVNFHRLWRGKHMYSMASNLQKSGQILIPSAALSSSQHITQQSHLLWLQHPGFSFFFTFSLWGSEMLLGILRFVLAFNLIMYSSPSVQNPMYGWGYFSLVDVFLTLTDYN